MTGEPSGQITLVSHVAASPTTAGNGGSGATPLGISHDGRFVTFVSLATDLLSGQMAYSGSQVFLYDRLADSATLVSHRAGLPAMPTSAGALSPVLSGDGRFVAFASGATDLVTDQVDTNDGQDVFLFDRESGEILLASHAAGAETTAGAAESGRFTLSDDGGAVAYLSRADDLTAGHADPSQIVWDAYVFDRATRTNVLASHAAGSPTTSGDVSVDQGQIPAISDDGRYTVFASGATDLVAGQVDSAWVVDLFLFDRATGDTTLVSHTGGATPSTVAGNQFSGDAQISADGSAVAFTSLSRLGYGPSPWPGDPNVFLFRRGTGGVSLVSHPYDAIGGAAISRSLSPGLSADGRSVAFTSFAWDIVPNDFNSNDDVFLCDAGSPLAPNTLVSRRAPGLASLSAANESSTSLAAAPSLSDDGRYAYFLTGSVDDSPFVEVSPQLAVFDRVTGTSHRVSEIPGCPGCSSYAYDPAVSADGLMVAFSADSLAAATILASERLQVYSRDGTNAVRRVSPAAAVPSRGANDLSDAPATSSDGRTIAFESLATDLVSGATDDNLNEDVFLVPPGGSPILVSHAAGAPLVAAQGASIGPRLSGDGRYAAFTSSATDLVAGIADGNGEEDVFLYDRDTGSSLLVSRSAVQEKRPGNHGAHLLGLSRDGRFVLFLSSATDLVTGQVDLDATSDLFLFDRATRKTVLVSRAAGTPATAADGPSLTGVLSADGRFVAFLSSAANLVPGQAAGSKPAFQVFLFDRLAGETVLVSHAASLATTPRDDATYGELALSADGRFLAWGGLATDIAAGQVDANGASDIFIYDRTTGTNRLVSRTLADALRTGNGPSTHPAISADGRTILFTSAATDLVAGDWNGKADVFLDRAPTTPGAFFTVPPCRVTDSRTTGAALASNAAQTLSLHAHCGIPSTARAVSVNLTIVGGNASGFVTLYPGDQPAPATSTLNFRAGQVKANNAIAPLATDGSGRLALRSSYTGTGPAQVIVDVNGYFE